MSDRSIPDSRITQTDIVKLSHAEEGLPSFREQSEWYRLRKESFLCDCSNCINARDLKEKTGLVGESVVRQQAPPHPKQTDIRQHWPTPDIRSLFRFILPSDEDIATSHIYS